MIRKTILPVCYLPPLSWFRAYLSGQGEEILLEKHEHFPKQTYRNRCHIHSPNGLLALTVPIQHGSGQHSSVKDIRISRHQPWQKTHWRSLEAAYRSSAFFEFFEDELARFYEQDFRFLFDLNEQLLTQLMQWMKITPRHGFTEFYEKDPGPEVLDLRETIHPKKPSYTSVQPYYQVFEDRNGFLPDLSVIDLLFNHGSRAAAMIVE